MTTGTRNQKEETKEKEELHNLRDRNTQLERSHAELTVKFDATLDALLLARTYEGINLKEIDALKRNLDFEKVSNAALLKTVDRLKADNARMLESLSAETNSWTDMQAENAALTAENEKLRNAALKLDAAAARLVDYFDEVKECTGRADYGVVCELIDKLEEAMPIHTDITAAMTASPDTKGE